MWLWGVWLGRSVTKCVCEVGGSAVFEVRLVFGLQNRPQASLNYVDGTIRLLTLGSIVGPHRPYAIEGPFETLSTWTQDLLGSKLVCKGQVPLQKELPIEDAKRTG